MRELPKYRNWLGVMHYALRIGLALCAMHFALCLSASADPSWWSERGVTISSATNNDYAAATAGQLKWFAACAKAELDAKLPGGAGPAVSALVASFVNTNNYTAINIGQLKNVAAPFYDRLDISYPWPAPSTNDNNYALANLGQVKNVFGFQIGSQNSGGDADVDMDGLPDWWELAYFGGVTNASPVADPDGDGWNNLQEYLRGGRPSVGLASDANGTLRLIVLTPLRQGGAR